MSDVSAVACSPCTCCQILVGHACVEEVKPKSLKGPALSCCFSLGSGDLGNFAVQFRCGWCGCARQNPTFTKIIVFIEFHCFCKKTPKMNKMHSKQKISIESRSSPIKSGFPDPWLRADLTPIETDCPDSTTFLVVFSHTTGAPRPLGSQEASWQGSHMSGAGIFFLYLASKTSLPGVPRSSALDEPALIKTNQIMWISYILKHFH